MTGGAVLRLSAPALLLSAALLLPFLGKAFTIDDPVFLDEARHALVDPLHPTAFDISWNKSTARVSAIVPTGPGMAWLLVPAVISSRPEEVAHLTQIAMLGLAIVATVGLALRLGLAPPWARAAGLLLAATPAVLGMGGTAMPDVPAMALGIAGIQQAVAWGQDRRARQGASAALLLGLAPVTRTHLVLLWPVAAMFLAGNALSLDAWRRGPFTRWLPLLAAPIVTGLVTAVTRDPAPAGASIAGAAAGFASTGRVVPNLLAFAVHWTLALPFAIPWAALRWRALIGRPLLLLGATAGAAALVYAAHPGETPWLLAPVGGLTAAALTDVLHDALRRRDGAELTLGAWLLLALPAVVYVHLPSKYLLASAPAAAILVARALSTQPALGRPVLAVTVAASALLGVAILRADAAQGEAWRAAARTLVAPEVGAGRRVWIVGQWGFQWYGREAGGRLLLPESSFPADGDLVVACTRCEPHVNVGELPHLVPVRQVRHEGEGGRVMDKGTGSGFFSNSWGYLPWAWGGGALEGFDVFRVNGAASPPPAGM